MNVSLTPELNRVVKEKIATGMYNNASEVVREALRGMLERERENQWLQREAAIGFAQLKAGQTVVVETKDDFAALLRGEG